VSAWDRLRRRPANGTPPPAGDERPPRLALGMWKRFVLGGLAVVLLSAATLSTAVLLEVKDIADRIARLGGPPLKLTDSRGRSVLTAAEAGQPQTFLLLGSDRRIGDRQPPRSDTMMLVRIDPHNQAISVMSLPRDLKVRFPGIGTRKLNFAYQHGGPRLAVQTIQRLLNVPINHVIDTNFMGFRALVEAIGCVYVDVDRRYYNADTGPGGYAAINIQEGYQRLCGKAALQYVRYRHTDTDLVRAARQQDFLRQAKAQVSTRRLLDNRDRLIDALMRHVRTDIRGSRDVLRVANLVAYAILNNQPVREVPFRAVIAPWKPGEPSYVVAKPAWVRQSVRRFMTGAPTAGPQGRLKPSPADRRAARKRAGRGSTRRVVRGLEDAAYEGRLLAGMAARQLPYPVFYLTRRIPGSVYARQEPRVYRIRDQRGRTHWSYRMVLKFGEVPEYYGLQGTTWRTPPILAGPHRTRRINGRTYLLYSDGGRLSLVAWRTPRATYWISNTLLRSISNGRMLDLAVSTAATG
jgi:LCP family protein required for cell wall assembly